MAAPPASGSRFRRGIRNNARVTPGDKIRARALEAGFDLVGIAPARRSAHGDAFLRWLERGLAADMTWMARDAERRLDPRRVLPGAQSVIVVGLSYAADAPPDNVWGDALRGRIACYAWGRDYHDVMRPRLEELARAVQAEAGPGAACRVFADTSPVLEREAGRQAGLGFIGRNTNLIHPDRGSCFFLGGVLTSLELDVDEHVDGHCGSCRRCMSACPMGALVESQVLDARRCISYLTVENRGPIPEALRPSLGRWVFGCDECQSLCPFVLRRGRPSRTGFLHFVPEQHAPRLEELLRLGEKDFRARYDGTPVMRTRCRGLRRNAAVAAGNSGRPELVPALEQVLRDEDPLLREHARWALARLRAG